VEWHDNPFNRFILRPRDHAFLDPERAEAMGLDRREHGMLLCVDQDGGRWTLVGDAEYLRTLLVAPDGVIRNLAIPGGKFPTRWPGWPEDWKSKEGKDQPL
jgi:hypothetical protein